MPIRSPCSLDTLPEVIMERVLRQMEYYDSCAQRNALQRKGEPMVTSKKRFCVTLINSTPFSAKLFSKSNCQTTPSVWTPSPQWFLSPVKQRQNLSEGDATAHVTQTSFQRIKMGFVASCWGSDPASNQATSLFQSGDHGFLGWLYVHLNTTLEF